MPPAPLLCILLAMTCVTAAAATERPPLRLPDCHSRPGSWTAPRSWTNASYCPRLHTIHCEVYDPSGCIQIGDTFFIFPDGAPNNTHYASKDLLHWSPRNHSWFHGLTGGISATPSGFYAHWLGERAVALGDPRAGGLGALDRWNCTAPISGGTPHGCGAPISGGTLRDPGRALQLEPAGPWLLISAGGGSPNTGPNGHAAGKAGIDLLEMADDTLNDVVHRSSFLRLQSQGGSKSSADWVWRNQSLATGDIECPEAFRMGPEKVVATGGVWRENGPAGIGMSFTNEWFTGTAVAVGAKKTLLHGGQSSASAWSFQMEHRGHLDYGNYYSGKTSGDSVDPASGRRFVYGEVQPIRTNEAGATSWMGVCGSHHTIPRELVLDETLGLRVLPLPELKTLRLPNSQQTVNATSATQTGSQAELRLTCSYNPSSAADLEFGVDVLMSPDGTEHLRVGLSNIAISTAPPGLRLFARHVNICNATDASGQVNGARICNATNAQVAPLPPAALLPARGGSSSPSAATPVKVNLTIIVDGGLVESFAAESVALTSLTDPSTAIPPGRRLARTFGSEGNDNVHCEATAWRLAL